MKYDLFELTIHTRASIFKIVGFHNNKSMRGINNKKNYETINFGHSTP